MKSKLKYLYSINVKQMILISPKVYKILTEDQDFVLKEVESLSMENLYHRLALSKVTFFNLPLQSVNSRYIEEINHKYYILSRYYQDESTRFDELKMNFYLKAIAYLHRDSIYPLKVNDGYFKESTDYIENNLNFISSNLEEMIKQIEHQEYYSPFEWYFLNTYQKLQQAISNSRKYLDLLREEFEKLTSIELTLTYQNFSFDHILMKEEKIISLEQMSLAPPFYDLVDFVEKNYNKKIDIVKLMANYMSIYPYNLYQKYWLLSLLFIPKIEFSNDQFDNIQLLYLQMNLLKCAEDLEANLFSQTESE